MELWVIWYGTGGEIERRRATKETVVETVIEMLRMCPVLDAGDRIEIQEVTP